jgi:hypothetical protein
MGLIDRDVKTDYNFLDVSDEKNKISFVSDSQAQRKLSQGVDIKSIFNKNNKTTIGRIIKGILSDNNIVVTDRQVEEFVNKFKAKWESRNIKEDSIRIVSGEDIRFWYLADNYCTDTMSRERGSLGKSCMRYDECQSFLDIYVNNPEQVSMIIFTEMDGEEEKLRARALLWETNEGTYRDRVYFTMESEEALFNDWLDKNLGKPYNKINPSTVEVNLKNGGKFNEYPYMDSFCYYRPDTSTLSMFEPSNEEYLVYYLHQTDGTYENLSQVYCDVYDDYYDRNDVVWSEVIESYILKADAVFGEYQDSYILKEDAVKSEKYGWLFSEFVNYVYLNSEKSKNDYYPIPTLCLEHFGYINDAGKIEYYDKSVKPNLKSLNSEFEEYLDKNLINNITKSNDETVLYFIGKNNEKYFSVSLEPNITYAKMTSGVWGILSAQFDILLNSPNLFDTITQLVLGYLSKKSGINIDKLHFASQI